MQFTKDTQGSQSIVCFLLIAQCKTLALFQSAKHAISEILGSKHATSSY
jgi:hypothetical protein